MRNDSQKEQPAGGQMREQQGTSSWNSLVTAFQTLFET